MKPLIFLLAATALLSAQTVEITAEPHHHQVFENQFVRVFYVEVPPRQSTLMHDHGHDYIFVTLGASEVSNEVVGKAPATIKLADGETHFTPGNFAHVARNLSSQPFRNVTIEILQDEKFHAAKTKDAKQDERALEILPGGTQQIIFVEDGVRASEFELNPAGAVPPHAKAGAQLLVAVTDLQLEERAASPMHMNHNAGMQPHESKAPAPAHATLTMKAGDTKWLAANYKYELTNASNHAAKFVTLEFR